VSSGREVVSVSVLADHSRRPDAGWLAGSIAPVFLMRGSFAQVREIMNRVLPPPGEEQPQGVRCLKSAGLHRHGSQRRKRIAPTALRLALDSEDRYEIAACLNLLGCMAIVSDRAAQGGELPRRKP
jgi:hypothetical protein